MSQFQSDLITPENCRKILKAHQSERLAIYLYAYDNEFDLGDFRVKVEGDRVSLFRYQKGVPRSVRKDEFPLLERRFRRVLKHAVEPVAKSPRQFEPLEVDIDALIALLAVVLATVPPRVRQKAERAVRLACEKPGTWLQEYGHIRGLKKPTENLHVLAFLDALIDARAATELDHRSEADELAGELRKIGGRLGFDVEAPEDNEISKSLRTLRRSLKQAGWVLIVLDINSDSYPLFVVREATTKQVQALIRKVGIRVAKV